MKNKRSHIGCIIFLTLAMFRQPLAAGPAPETLVGTAFTYQGQLRDGGTNANGNYTIIFALYNAASGGIQIGSSITTNSALVNGLFSVNLDFGAGVFSGNARWLDITVTNGGTSQTLSPRVQVLASPYAQFAAVAATVTNGAIMNSQLAVNSVATANIQNNAITAAQIANGAVTNSNIAANAVNATNIASGQAVKSLNGLTDTVILSAGTNVTLSANANILQINATVPSCKVFDQNGTFVAPANVTKIIVELWGGGGGGGGGGGAGNNGLTYGGNGGGGGGGGYGKQVLSVTPGDSATITIGSGGTGGSGGLGSVAGVTGITGGTGGTGGTTSFGSATRGYLTANGGLGGSGGSGGSGSASSGGGNSGDGGDPGTSTTDIAVIGFRGLLGGTGGAAANGGAGGIAPLSGSNPGSFVNGQTPGGGGSGNAGGYGGNPIGHAGYSGASGRVIVWW